MGGALLVTGDTSQLGLYVGVTFLHKPLDNAHLRARDRANRIKSRTTHYNFKKIVRLGDSQKVCLAVQKIGLSVPRKGRVLNEYGLLRLRWGKTSFEDLGPSARLQTRGILLEERLSG